MRVFFTFLALAAGCHGSDSAKDTGGLPPEPTDTATTATNPNYGETGFAPGDEGSLMLVQTHDFKGLYAMFVNQQPGFENLAYCAVSNSVCIPGFATTDLPAPYDGTNDKGDPYDPSIRFAPEFSQYRYVGDQIAFGPWTAPLYYSVEHGFAYYYVDLTGEPDVLGPVGVTWGVQWGDYSGTDDLVLHDPIEMLSPAEGANFDIVNATTFPVEWVPQEDGGTIHLFAMLGDPLFTGYQFTLQDDGYFDVPVDVLTQGAVVPVPITFSLERWNSDSVTYHGNTLNLTQLSQSTFSANFEYVGSRTELKPADNCAEAVNMTPIDAVGSYQYWGRMTGFATDEQNGCGLGTGGNPDGMVRVDLPPLTALEATYQLTDPLSDAAIYLVDNCMANGCLAGSDANHGVPDPESIAYFNTSTTDTKTVYIVLSGTLSTTSIFTLDVVVNQLLDPMMDDECLAAEQQAPIGDGSYYSADVAFLNTLDPGVACTGDQTPGPDGITKISVPAGKTVTVLAEMDPPGDPAIYLMTNCTLPQYCVAGADLSLGQGEIVAWTNNSPYAENIYLVVDTKQSTLQPYFLTISF